MAYALLCVVVPVAWGLVVYWVSGLIERRVLPRPHSAPDEAAPPDAALPLDYYI